MRCVVVACLMFAACYQGPSSSVACKLRCTASCPEGMTCVDGFCVAPGGSCGAVDDAAIVDAPPPSCVTHVAPGYHHVCSVKANGTVWCAGENAYGQLGNDMTGGELTAAVQAVDANGPITDAIAVAAGGAVDAAFSCALRAGGTVWCWGSNNWGQLGDYSYTPSARAVQVVVAASGLPLTDIVELGAGGYHACARDASGGAWCWGRGENGRIGDNGFATRGAAVAVLDDLGQPVAGITKLAVGRTHNCIINTASEIWCWGANDNGRVGDNAQSDRGRPVLVSSGTSVSCGRLHTCAAHADGTASCWGGGFHGRIGDGVFANRLVPTKVLVEPGGAQLQGVSAVTAAGVSCALMTDGRLQCWGANVHGQTGNGTGANVPAPVLDTGYQPVTNIDRVFAGSSHVCARTKAGAMLCWGRNESGELGNGSTNNVGLATPHALSCP